MVSHPLHGQAEELLMKLEENLLSSRGWRGRAHPRPKTVPSTGPGHAWIREEMERVEDFCYTYKPKYQKL